MKGKNSTSVARQWQRTNVLVIVYCTILTFGHDYTTGIPSQGFTFPSYFWGMVFVLIFVHPLLWTRWIGYRLRRWGTLLVISYAVVVGVMVAVLNAITYSLVPDTLDNLWFHLGVFATTAVLLPIGSLFIIPRRSDGLINMEKAGQ